LEFNSNIIDIKYFQYILVHKSLKDVFLLDTKGGIQPAVEKLFNDLETSGPILKSSKEVYIKINGIDAKKHTHTSPEVLKAVIQYLKRKGAQVYVMENSTQGNMTRIVFGATEYKKICKETGAKPIYLDEEKSEIFTFRGKPSIQEDNKGYILKEFHLPKTIVKIINNRDKITYINLPKLKTHSMAVVTLGIKNQWGFPQHADRNKDHNYNLHSKFIDVYEIIKPDLTIIDGTEGTIHGHYPPTTLEDQLVIPFNVLIGGRDTLAVDVVGARLFGLGLDEVPHLRIAYKRGLGEGDLKQINIHGKDITQYNKKYDWNLLDNFPKDVKIVKGKDLLCQEGCKNNPLTTLQVFSLDYAEKFKGGFFIIMGKGFEENIVDDLKREGYDRGLVAGFCAIEEVGNKILNAFGKKKVYFSHNCNNLAETITALSKLSTVPIMDLTPISALKTLKLLIGAKLHGSKALIPKIL